MSAPSREPEPRTPHLRAVPTPRADEQRVSGAASQASPVAGEVEAVDRAVVEAQAALIAQAEPTVRVVPRRSIQGFGSAQSPEAGFGTRPTLVTHLLTTGGAAGVGAVIGGASSGTLQGAGIGALSNLTVLGVSAALLGTGRLSTLERILYAVLAMGAGAGAGYLVWRRMR